MGFSTFIEMNHDYAHEVANNPGRVGELLADYMRACDSTIAVELDRHYGIKVWASGGRSGWESDARCVLNREYRERMEEIHRNNAARNR